MVVTLWPAACVASMAQLFTARPFRCTVQAPHWLVSQPTWVPVRRRCSRMNSDNSVCGATSRDTSLPLTFRVMLGMESPAVG